MTQPRIVYVNGHYLAESEAQVSVFDRGFLFADAIYEVSAVLGGWLIDFDGHMARMRRSLAELDIPLGLDEAALLDIHRELIRRNNIQQGLVYLQITRGVADRDFLYPNPKTPSTLVLFTQEKALLDNPIRKNGLKVVSLPDLRWGRRDIKTVQLLYASMAKTQARKQDADDAWLVENGHINEGTSSNVWIVDKEGVLITPRLSKSLLHGITRAAVMTYARESGMQIVERNFSVAQAQNAREAFVTSATSFVLPVVQINGMPVGDGRPGPVSHRLFELYVAESRLKAL